MANSGFIFGEIEGVTEGDYFLDRKAVLLTFYESHLNF